MIQTYQPNHPVIQKVLKHDYDGMYLEELAERKTFKYPPFQRLIKIKLKHANSTKTHQAARYFHSLMVSKFGNRVLGPEHPLVGRVKRLYIQEILLKVERKSSLKFVRENISNAISDFRKYKQWNSVRIIIDVDPL